MNYENTKTGVNTDEQTKFYSQKAIAITTFFGGLLAAGILMRRNYLNLNQETYAKHALFYGIAFTILILIGIIILPENVIDKIPNSIFPAIYSLIIYYVVEKTQGKALKAHKENGGEFYSAWKAVKVGVLSMVAFLIAIAFIAFLMGDFSKQEPDKNTQLIIQSLDLFFKNEQKSVKVFQSAKTKDTSYVKNELKKSIALWKTNKELIKNLQELDGLLENTKVFLQTLMDYSNLRIEHFTLIYKRLNENTDKYKNRIEAVGLKIEKKVKELNKLAETK